MEIDYMNPKVSIIIPTYNVENYFTQSMESVIDQSLKEIEIIPVDDGSPDNCGKMMDSFAKLDQRIKPIHQKNGGYGSAVNSGIKVATGEYIAILEPDDYINLDLYRILYAEAIESDLDICRYNSYFEVRKNMMPYLMQTYYPGKHDFLTDHHLCEYFALGQPGICFALYKRSLIVDNCIKLDENNSVFHDVDFVAIAYLLAKKIKIIQMCGYYYRRDVPTQSVVDIRKIFCIIQAIDNFFLSLSKHNISLHGRLRAAVLGYCVSHLAYSYERTKQMGEPPQLIVDSIKRILLGEKKIICRKEISDILATLDIAISHENVLYKGKSCPDDLTVIQKLIIAGASYTEILAHLYMQLSLCQSSEEYLKIANEITLAMLGSIGFDNKIVFDVVKKIFASINRKDILKMRPASLAALSFYLYKNGEKEAFDTLLSLFPNQEKLNKIYSSLSEYSEASLEIFKKNKKVPVRVKRSAILEKEMLSSERRFLKYISGKTIAVVGNSPCEIGLGKGPEIDEHDIVIRFNNYIIDKQNENDYGTKECVWTITPNLESLNNKHRIYKYDFVISCEGSYKIAVDRCKYFYDYVVAGGSFFRIKARKLIVDTNIRIISMGLYMVNYLAENISEIKKLSLYGFALTDHYEGKRHYFKGDPVSIDKLKFHRWDKEREYFDLLRKKIETIETENKG